MATNQTAIMIDRLAARANLVGDAISKAKGELPKPKASSLSDGHRSYIVSDWRSTCSRCPKTECQLESRECDLATFFPVFHKVDVEISGGIVVRASCREGKKAGGTLCGEKCRHIDRVQDALEGREAKGVEISIISSPVETMPKCPNCGQRWAVSQRGVVFECRSPTCSRDGKPWLFKKGDMDRPSPIRHGLSIMRRDPGRMVRK